jgi:hypothetical protein
MEAVTARLNEQATQLTDRALVGWRILLILLFFNMLVCAYCGRVGWMLFWAIAFSSGVHEHGYEYGKTEERLRRIGGFAKFNFFENSVSSFPE